MKTSKKAQQCEQLVLALLQQPSLEKAAAALKISAVTAWRISKMPEFQKEYRRARQEAYGQAIGRLQQASGVAVSAILRVLADPQHSAASRVRAADCVLHHAAKACEWEDLSVRVAELERIRQREESAHGVS
jgi:hypothetical protein